MRAGNARRECAPAMRPRQLTCPSPPSSCPRPAGRRGTCRRPSSCGTSPTAGTGRGWDAWARWWAWPVGVAWPVGAGTTHLRNGGDDLVSQGPRVGAAHDHVFTQCLRVLASRHDDGGVLHVLLLLLGAAAAGRKLPCVTSLLEPVVEHALGQRLVVASLPGRVLDIPPAAPTERAGS